MKASLRSTLLLVGLVFPLLAVQAGVMIQQEERTPGQDLARAHTTFYLDAGKLRIDTKNADGEETTIIFDEGRQVVWVIDHSARSYYELTQTEVQAMGEHMGQAMKELEAQLAEMPPEQRQMMERMMERMRGQMQQAPVVTVEQVGGGEEVGQFVCTHYRLLTGGELSSEIWTAPLNQLQLQEAEFGTFQALARFFEPLGQQGPKGIRWRAGGEQIEGFPVRSVFYAGRRVVAEEELLKAERKPLEASVFKLPPGLKKTEFQPGD